MITKFDGIPSHILHINWLYHFNSIWIFSFIWFHNKHINEVLILINVRVKNEEQSKYYFISNGNLTPCEIKLHLKM
jgi:hypothetical protein